MLTVTIPHSWNILGKFTYRSLYANYGAHVKKCGYCQDLTEITQNVNKQIKLWMLRIVNYYVIFRSYMFMYSHEEIRVSWNLPRNSEPGNTEAVYNQSLIIHVKSECNLNTVASGLRSLTLTRCAWLMWIGAGAFECKWSSNTRSNHIQGVLSDLMPREEYLNKNFAMSTNMIMRTVLLVLLNTYY